MQAVYQDRLQAIPWRARYMLTMGKCRNHLQNNKPDSLYAMTVHYGGWKNLTHVSLDGAHGTAGILRVAEAIDLQLTPIRNSRGFTTGYHVTDIPKESP